MLSPASTTVTRQGGHPPHLSTSQSPACLQEAHHNLLTMTTIAHKVVCKALASTDVKEVDMALAAHLGNSKRREKGILTEGVQQSFVQSRTHLPVPVAGLIVSMARH